MRRVAARDDLDPPVVGPDRHLDVAVEADRARLGLGERPGLGAELRRARRDVEGLHDAVPPHDDFDARHVDPRRGPDAHVPATGRRSSTTSSPGCDAAELELDDRPARDDRVPLLDRGDDGERVDGLRRRRPARRVAGRR